MVISNKPSGEKKSILNLITSNKPSGEKKSILNLIISNKSSGLPPRINGDFIPTASKWLELIREDFYNRCSLYAQLSKEKYGHDAIKFDDEFNKIVNTVEAGVRKADNHKNPRNEKFEDKIKENKASIYNRGCDKLDSLYKKLFAKK
jgi:hypothetical protein